ncbi:BAG family molecular chaperone regulator 6-like [Canna indica]|uniref:BAG family molecular chaperone regulator 6-like n=1 Tax=Canna indica TaxID=4628 RepID=A0AAQ3K5G5_9LILI|nr:BAG family molecular chaperone regulator 6-like [Canna indica]
MFPPYGYMEPYPHTSLHHCDHIPHPYHPYPSWETLSPQTRINTHASPSSSGPWTINGSVTHQNPTDCNSCCNHSYPPGYYGFRPPCPYIPSPPPQLCCHGSYPPYYGSYPSFAIPPCYPSDQNPYGYNSVKAHCCGCPNHTCNKGDNNSLKIEEPKPENDQDNRSSSLIQLPKYPYPVVWIPPGYSKDKESNKSSESSPAFWNGWIPTDISSSNGRKWDGDGKRNLQSSERRNQFPWPIVWMPGDQKIEGTTKNLKEKNSDPQVEEKLPSSLKIIPLKLLADESHGEKPDVDDKHVTLGHPKEVAEKESRTKTIPVRQLEEDNHEKLKIDEKHNDKDKEKSISIPEKQKENGAKKSPDSKQLPQAKTSKLPPVCLRVDPLPRKKNANGTSRSPSPPNRSGKEKVSKDKTEKEQLLVRDKQEMPKKMIQVVHVNDEHEAEKSKKKIQDTMATSLNEGATKVVDNQVDKEVEKQPIDENGVGKRPMENTKRTISGPRNEKKILSNSDAATRIQSAYRGFEVRRWQPLEKLRKISQIRQKAEIVKKQIQEFEAISKDLDLKQKTVISETIMNLLLQLDTIQGLHQTLRDVRKSVARELVGLQERLDSLDTTSTVENSSSEAVSAAVSSAPINLEPECVSVQSVDAAHPLEVASVGGKEESNVEPEVAYVDEKEETNAEQQRDVEVVKAESETGPGSFKSFSIERGSIPLEGREIDFPKEQVSSHGNAAESHLEKEQPINQEEVIKEIFEAHSTPTEEVTKLEADKQFVSHASTYQLGDQLSDPESGNDIKQDVRSEQSTLCTEGEANDVAAEESKPEMMELVEPTSGTTGVDFDIKETVVPGKEVDTMRAVPVPAVESNPVEKAVADNNVMHMTKDNSCSEQAVLGTSAENTNVQCIVGNLEEQAEDVDSIITGHLFPTCNGGHTSTSAEAYLEDVTNSMLPDAMNIRKDEGHSSNETFKANGGKVDDGAALEEGKDGFVPTDYIPSSTVKELSVSTREDGEFQNLPLPDAVDIKKDECVTRDETFEANVNRYDDAAAKISEVDSFPNEDTPLVNSEAAVSNSNSVASVGEYVIAPGINLSKEEKKLVEENEKLREMLEKLLEAGKAQMGVIANLNGRVKDLERKLSQKKRCKVKSLKPKRISPQRFVS